MIPKKKYKLLFLLKNKIEPPSIHIFDCDHLLANKMTYKYIKDAEGNFVCPHCNVTKKNQNTMHYHMKKHEEQLEHVCKTCNKGFLQKQTLDLHMKSKHPELVEGKTKKIACPFDGCEFSALTKGNCIIHMLRIHFQDEIKEIMNVEEDTKVISCTECKNEFNSSSAFHYHCKGCIDFDKDSKKYELFTSI